jgi:hypothetical protein
VSDAIPAKRSKRVVRIVIAAVVGLLLLSIPPCVWLGYIGFVTVLAWWPQIESQAKYGVPEGLAQGFLRDLVTGRVEEAYDSTTRTFKAEQTLEEFRAFLNEHPLLQRHTNARLFATTHGPELSPLTIEYVLTGDGETMVTIHLVRDEDGWKVNGLTVP